MALLIKNGRIITPAEDCVADIWCEGETITRIGRDLDAPPDTTVVDATGQYVFPGFIDPHVHVYLPFMGTYAKDDYTSASKAALVGGTTSIIEMVCPAKSDDAIEAFELWASKAEGKSACDYTFHMGVSRFDDRTADQLEAIVKQGIASFKVFLAYKGAFGVDDAELYHTMTLAKRLGVIVTAHCENPELVAQLQAKLLAEGKTGPEFHEPSRPTAVETSGVHHLMTFAEMTGAHCYVVHTSCREAVLAAQAAQQRGVRAWIETVIPYLVLDSTYAEQSDFRGAKYVMSPPIRAKVHQPFLWDALRTRLISTVATDHAPFDFRGQKEMGRDDFTKIPNGIPSIEHRVTLLYTHGVAPGRIDLATFVDCASTQAAKLFGLFPRKGTIAPGSDADLVVWDPQYKGTITHADQHMATDYNAFEGWPITGRPSVVTVRGQIAAENGKFTGDVGRGQLLRREPTH